MLQREEEEARRAAELERKRKEREAAKQRRREQLGEDYVSEEEEEVEEEEEEGWGPVYGEEEDLRRAIEMSLAEHQERTGGECAHGLLHVACLTHLIILSQCKQWRNHP